MKPDMTLKSQPDVQSQPDHGVKQNVPSGVTPEKQTRAATEQDMKATETVDAMSGMTLEDTPAMQAPLQVDGQTDTRADARADTQADTRTVTQAGAISNSKPHTSSNPQSDIGSGNQSATGSDTSAIKKSEISFHQPSPLPEPLPEPLPNPLPQTLPELRELIDRVDTQIINLLHQRALISLGVGAFKKKHHLAVWQPQREQELLEEIASKASETLPAKHLTAIYKEILSSSRALQKGETVGYLGPEGTFSHLAAGHIFGQSISTLPFGSIAQLVSGLQGERCDYAVIPIENSLYGTVSESFDQLLQHRSVQIVGEHVERIQLAALTLDLHTNTSVNLSRDTQKGKDTGSREDICPNTSADTSADTTTASNSNASATMCKKLPTDTITTVFSHPQPLGQCSQWIQKNFPTARIEPVESTAAAALKAASTPGSVAIGHEKMGVLNDLPLKVLATNIEDSPNNWTRFFILKLAPNALSGTLSDTVLASVSGTGLNSVQNTTQPNVRNATASTPLRSSGNKSTLAFSVADTPGSLAHVLSVFAKAKTNLSKLESRPSRQGTWKYVFFADLNCNVLEPQYAPMLEELANYCHDIRILGVYTASTSEAEYA